MSSRLPALNLEKVTVGRVFPSGPSSFSSTIALLSPLCIHRWHWLDTAKGGMGEKLPQDQSLKNLWHPQQNHLRTVPTHTHTSLYLPLQLCQGSMLLISISQLSSPPTPARAGTQLITKASFPSCRDSTAEGRGRGWVRWIIGRDWRHLGLNFES